MALIDRNITRLTGDEPAIPDKDGNIEGKASPVFQNQRCCHSGGRLQGHAQKARHKSAQTPLSTPIRTDRSGLRAIWVNSDEAVLISWRTSSAGARTISPSISAPASRQRVRAAGSSRKAIPFSRSASRPGPLSRPARLHPENHNSRSCG